MIIPEETILRADELLLRPLWLTSAAEIYEAAIASRREVGQWLEWCHADYQISETRDFLATLPEAWARREAFGFSILDAATNRLLGSVGLNSFHDAHPFCNLGYWMRTDATGRGAASRAARCVAGWALRELGLRRVEIVAATGNIASQRVAEKAGAYREGVLRQRLTIKGAPTDAVMFSLVAEDFA